MRLVDFRYVSWGLWTKIVHRRVWGNTVWFLYPCKPVCTYVWRHCTFFTRQRCHKLTLIYYWPTSQFKLNVVNGWRRESFWMQPEFSCWWCEPPVIWSRKDQSKLWMVSQLARSLLACIANRNRSEDDADQTAATYKEVCLLQNDLNILERQMGTSIV